MESLFDLSFKSVDEARTAIDAVTLPLGCSLVKNRTRPNLVELRCCKGRKFRSQHLEHLPASRRRETSSQMTACPYRLVISRHSAVSPWKIRRSRNDTANEHNHELLAPGALSRFRNKIIEKRKWLIMSLYKSGIKPTQILAHLQDEDDPDVKTLTRHDIYNTIRKEASSKPAQPVPSS